MKNVPAVADGEEFDAIVVGSGAGGATVARELTRRGKRVLLLERGGNSTPSDSLLYMASVSDYVPVADDAGMARAITTGGTTSLYFGVAEFPPLQVFRDLGIELSGALEEAKRELPLVEPLSDRRLGKQVLAVQQSALALGTPWVKTEAMLMDESKCDGEYTHSAIWRAKQYVDEAVRGGATLINRATVQKVLVEGRRAVGVEYELRIGRKRSEIRQARARRVIVAAGALATPGILRASGLAGIGERGFYSDPGFLIMGHVDGLRGGNLFPGCMGTNTEEDGILVGDGCLPRSMYWGFMLASRNLRNLFKHRKHVAAAVMVRDGLGGTVRPDGRFHKEYTREEKQKLEKGGALAQRIVENAGAKGIVRSDLSAAHVGGLLQIGQELDATLQTEFEGLHVCDCSLLPANVRLTPVFTLVCLGKYLAQRLEGSL